MIIEDELDNDNVVKMDTYEQVIGGEDDELDVNPE
jgi:hypothetical protein